MSGVARLLGPTSHGGFGPAGSFASAANDNPRCPRRSRAGLLLRRADQGAEPLFDLILVAARGGAQERVARLNDDTDLVALWRRLAADFGLDLLLEDRDGRPCRLAFLPGERVFARRWGSATRRRRPRFLARRQPGHRG